MKRETTDKAMIVGGSGFIGTGLALALTDSGMEVTTLDIVPPPTITANRCRHVFADITDRKSLSGLFSGQAHVFLLAALLAKRCREDPRRGWQTNVLGIANVLDALGMEAPSARVVFPSTGGIYAPQIEYPVAEDAPKRCQGIYVSSKLAGEAMVHAHAAAVLASAVVLRLFTVYGAGPAAGARGHFIASWIERIRAGLALTIHGDGTQTVDLTHVSDVARACRLAIETRLQPGETKTFNIGSGMETLINEVARWMQAYSPATRLVYQPELQDYGPRRQFGDIRCALGELGYKPCVRPRDGLTALLNGLPAGTEVPPCASNS